MSTPPAGIPEADWLATPAGVRTLILVQQQEIQALRQENDELRSQLTALASELASSRNSSKPPARRKGSGRKRGGQPHLVVIGQCGRILADAQILQDPLFERVEVGPPEKVNSESASAKLDLG